MDNKGDLRKWVDSEQFSKILESGEAFFAHPPIKSNKDNKIIKEDGEKQDWICQKKTIINFSRNSNPNK